MRRRKERGGRPDPASFHIPARFFVALLPDGMPAAVEVPDQPGLQPLIGLGESSRRSVLALAQQVADITRGVVRVVEYVPTPDRRLTTLTPTGKPTPPGADVRPRPVHD